MPMPITVIKTNPNLNPNSLLNPQDSLSSIGNMSPESIPLPNLDNNKLSDLINNINHKAIDLDNSDDIDLSLTITRSEKKDNQDTNNLSDNQDTNNLPDNQEIVDVQGINNLSNNQTILDVNSTDILEKLLAFKEKAKNSNFHVDLHWEKIRKRLNPTDDKTTSNSNIIHEEPLLIKNAEVSNLPHVEAVSDIFEAANIDPSQSINSFLEASPGRRLGNIGDLSLNQIIDLGEKYLNPTTKLFAQYGVNIDMFNILQYTPAFFLWRSVTNVFVKHAFAYDVLPLSHADTIMRQRQTRTFMFVYGPIMTGILLVAATISRPPITLTAEAILEINKLSSNKTDISEKVLSSGLGFFLSMKNKFPYWLRQVIIMLISILSFRYIRFQITANNLATSENTSIFNTIGITNVKWFLILSSILVLIGLLYNVLNIIFFVLFSKGKLKMPVYLPTSILNWLSDIKAISAQEDNGSFIERNGKIALLNLLTLCIGLISIYFIFL